MSDSPAGKPPPPGSGESGVPEGFEGLAAALRAGAAATGELTLDRATRIAANAVGTPIEELLLDLAITCRLAGGAQEPPFLLVRAFVGAWSDAALGYLHSATCENPLTGLATLAHVRTRLLELYRLHERTGDAEPPAAALVIVELERLGPDVPRLTWALRMIDLGELLRSAYDADEVIGQLGERRAVALVRRDERMQDRMARLLGHLHDWRRQEGVDSRLWIEHLPAAQSASEELLNSLAH